MFGKCNHVFGEITGGYQYCTKCNQAVPVACNHRWKIHNSADIRHRLYGHIFATEYHMVCQFCGEMKQEIFTLRS